eukprot:TRINITY_DN7537_c0_g1_i2.p1 TRINITY_DN7537_c0_g1~~TRINITY_DN7537_c0_g1_i2.p1  ORF type:complete len:109 (+),score=35.58 TRINITY_DN7537_c0_g1_i2:162-488(+)
MDPVSYDGFWAQRIVKEQSLLLRSVPRVEDAVLMDEEVREEKPRKKKKFMRLVKKAKDVEPKPAEAAKANAQKAVKEKTSAQPKEVPLKTSKLIEQAVAKAKHSKKAK